MTGEHLRDLRVDRNITQVQLAKLLNVQQSSISAWERGIAKPDFANQRKLADLYNITIDELFEREPPADVSAVKIPVLGKVQAGIPASAIEEILDYEEISPEQAARGEYFGLIVRGDSMSPRILDGDVVIVRAQPDVESGEVAVVAVNGDNATIKRVRKSAGGITLIPFNSAYDMTFYTNEQIKKLPVEIKGKVVELRGKF